MDDEDRDDLGAQAAREFTLEDAFLSDGDTPKPYIDLYRDADKALLELATRAPNVMDVKLRFGQSIEVPHHVREFWLSVPRLCPVAYLRRVLSREYLMGVYPSFVHLTLADTQQALLDDGERTLGSYGVGDGPTAVIVFDIMVGNIPVLRDRAQPQAAAPPAHAEDRNLRHMTRRTRQTAAAAADHPMADAASPQPEAPAVDAGGPRGRPRRAVMSPPAGQALQVRRRRTWTKEQTIAVLEGYVKYKNGWAKIKHDRKYEALLREWSSVDIKDRFRNLKNTWERKFPSTAKGEPRDAELVRRIKEVMNAELGHL